MNLKKIKKETIRLKIKRNYIKRTAKYRRKKINNKDFTIISNNCWAGFIYQSYGLRYNTPTIGMFFMAEDYIKFISKLKYYLSFNKFEEVEPTKSKWYEQIKNKDNFGKYPIAKIGDIELHLLHYKSVEEAQKKWNLRKKRINYNKILFKFSEMNQCDDKMIIKFQSLKLKNKLCFITKKYNSLKNDYTIVVYKKSNGLLSSYEPVGNSNKININKIINKL